MPEVTLCVVLDDGSRDRESRDMDDKFIIFILQPDVHALHRGRSLIIEAACGVRYVQVAIGKWTITGTAFLFQRNCS